MYRLKGWLGMFTEEKSIESTKYTEAHLFQKFWAKNSWESTGIIDILCLQWCYSFLGLLLVGCEGRVLG